MAPRPARVGRRAVAWANAWVVQHRPGRLARQAVQGEPFLIVGMVAVIRRLSMVSAKAENLLDTTRFRDVLLGSPSWWAQRWCSG